MRRVWETIMDWEGRRAALWMWIWHLDSWDAQSWQERSCRRHSHKTTPWQDDKHRDRLLLVLRLQPTNRLVVLWVHSQF
ncbi:hypothetical protein EV363DRAFT_1186632 [Boletus edulis]|nr:hypothetical protein EV363DRAFT_1186632 [Boletus edulis]